MISSGFPILRYGSTTALVGQEVKRTFSISKGFSAGLSGQNTLEAVGQNSGDFRDPCVRFLVHVGQQDRKKNKASIPTSLPRIAANSIVDVR
jgi:hypothetical protein